MVVPMNTNKVRLTATGHTLIATVIAFIIAVVSFQLPGSIAPFVYLTAAFGTLLGVLMTADGIGTAISKHKS